jgi:hypothetical protein
MAEIQNKDVMHQIRGMLESLKKDDPQQSQIILNLLQEVVKEYNSGRTMNIDKKLYDMINGALFETKKK